MYAKHGNLVEADASGAKASTKYLESRLGVIHGHAFLDHWVWKADKGLRICGFRVGNFEEKVWASPSLRIALQFGGPCLLSRELLRIFAQILYF